MKVLALITPDHSLPYDGWIDDLAEQGVFVTPFDVNNLQFLQPAFISRHLRHGDFEVVICLSDKHLQMANRGVELSGKTVKTTVMPGLPTPASNINIERRDAPAPDDAPTFLLLNITDARQAVEGFAVTATADARLRILGTGKARAVMPIVQLSRKLEVESRITWLGDDYNLQKECAGCSSFVASNRKLTPVEAGLCAAGVPCVDPADFTKPVERTDWCTCEFHVKQTVAHLLALRQQ